MTSAEMERLVLLIEECSEVQHVASKILRFGYDGANPSDNIRNRYLLERELGDLFAVIKLMKERSDIDRDMIDRAMKSKYLKLVDVNNKCIYFQKERK